MNQSVWLPFGPGVISVGSAFVCRFVENRFKNVPFGAICAIRPPWGRIVAVAHRFPSGPSVIPFQASIAKLPFVDGLNVLIVPAGVIRPIAVPSTNHTLPSGPPVIPVSFAAPPTRNSVICPGETAPAAALSASVSPTANASPSVAQLAPCCLTSLPRPQPSPARRYRPAI